MRLRIGYGYDLHRLSEERRCVIGGVEIPFERGLLGHSDADVLLHALIDALLGSVALGDIGSHFPDSDPAWKGADSAQLLTRVVEMLSDRGWVVTNVDATVIAESPKLNPYIDRIRGRISQLMGLDSAAISVKATTSEKTGALGRGEAIAAHAVVLVSGAGTTAE